MPKRRCVVLGMRLLAAAGAWSWVAAAQDVPPSEPPPTAPPPSEPAPPPSEPAPPPSEPAPPPSEPTPPPTAPPTDAAPAPPPPAPPVAPAPPSGSFPAPAPAAPEPIPEKKPVPRPTPIAPPAHAPAPEASSAPAHAPAPESKPSRASEGLFEEKRPLPESRPPRDDDDETDNFKIGPVVGVGVPSVLSIGGTLKLTRFLGGGVNLGLIPKVALSYYGDATLSYQHVDFYGRLYPFGGGFFLQGGAGYATVEGTLSKSFNLSALGVNTQVSYESRGSSRTLMLTALLGYFYTTGIGFSFGVDAGAQIPIAPSQIEFDSAVETGAIPPQLVQMYKEQYITPTDESVRDTLEKIGRTTIPTVNLRIGWIL